MNARASPPPSCTPIAKRRSSTARCTSRCTLSVAFGYRDARELAAVFQGKAAGLCATAARAIRPPPRWKHKVTRMEDGVATVCFGTGMAAIGAIVHGVAARRRSRRLERRFCSAIPTACSADAGRRRASTSASSMRPTSTNVRAALRPEDAARVRRNHRQSAHADRRSRRASAQLCRERGILYVVDNTMTSPYLFRPKAVGAGLVVNALTKYIGGHGNALGGALTDTGLFDWTRYPNIYDNYKTRTRALWGMAQIRKKGLRDLGAHAGRRSGAPHRGRRRNAGAAHGARLRQCAWRWRACWRRTIAFAAVLLSRARIASAARAGGELFKRVRRAVQLRARTDGIDCFDFLNRLTWSCCQSNLGDNRTLAIPVAHTIFFEMGAGAPRQHGHRRIADPGVGRHRGSRRPDRRLRAGAGLTYRALAPAVAAMRRRVTQSMPATSGIHPIQRTKSSQSRPIPSDRAR